MGKEKGIPPMDEHKMKIALLEDMPKEDQEVISDFLELNRNVSEFETENYPIVCKCLKCNSDLGQHSKEFRLTTVSSVPEDMANDLHGYGLVCYHCGQEMILERVETKVPIKGIERSSFFLVETEMKRY